MSTCSATNEVQQAQAAPLQPMATDPPPPPAAGAPAPAPPAQAAPAEASTTATGEQPNGQHHLLRHVLSAQQCSDALRHFGTSDSKAAARMVNRMSQRDLRDMFAKVYSVHTNSNNNTWLRRKLLEAVGASRRFYSAANKVVRPRTAKKDKGEGGAACASSSAGNKSPRARAAQPGTPRASALGMQALPSLPHAVTSPGPALPAGSPRALSQRLRQRSYGETHFPQHFTHQRLLQQAHGQPYPYGAAAYSEEEATCSERSGSDAHPRMLAPHASFDSGGASPTSAVGPMPQQGLAGPHAYYTGSNSSLQSSTFAAPALHAATPTPHAAAPRVHAYTPGAAPPLMPLPLPFTGRASTMPPPVRETVVGGVVVKQDPPRMGRTGSLAALTALLYPPSGPLPTPFEPQPAKVAQQVQQGPAQQQLAGAPSLGMGGLGMAPSLALQPSADLGVLFGPNDLPMCADVAVPTKQESGTGDDWLNWDDWQLPTLF